MMKQAICIIFLITAFTTINAQNGILDPSFGTNGIVVIDVGNLDNTSKSIAIQPDGKILMAGYSSTSISFFNVVRLNPDGSLDNSFGTNGVVSTALTSTSNASSIALQDDGKIIAGGHSWGGDYNEFTLIRYNSDGSLDATFGNSGIVTTSFVNKSGIGKSLVIQADGKIILAGYSYFDFSDADEFALVRYNSDGSPDNSFGTGGIVFTNFGNSMDLINSVTLQSDGKIIAGGFSAPQMALARYLTDGSLDNTFGTNGLVTTNISTTSQAIINGLALTQDGIYACGFSIDSTSNSTLVKYDYNGNISPGFGVNGILINNLAQHDLYKDIKIKGDKIVVGGTANNYGDFNFTLSQFDLSGNPVMSFGTNGVFMVAPTNSFNQLEAIAIQADGKILATGFCQDFPYDIGIIRVISNTLLSVEGFDSESKISIYPNPTSNFIYINSSSLGIFTDIKLLDVTGKVLTQINRASPEFNESELKMDLYNFPIGIYFLTVSNDGLRSVYKIVKE
jgi:uncharacterized delta-60 repeat protein